LPRFVGVSLAVFSGAGTCLRGTNGKLTVSNYNKGWE